MEWYILLRSRKCFSFSTFSSPLSSWYYPHKHFYTSNTSDGRTWRLKSNYFYNIKSSSSAAIRFIPIPWSSSSHRIIRVVVVARRHETQDTSSLESRSHYDKRLISDKTRQWARSRETIWLNLNQLTRVLHQAKVCSGAFVCTRARVKSFFHHSYSHCFSLGYFRNIH